MRTEPLRPTALGMAAAPFRLLRLGSVLAKVRTIVGVIAGWVRLSPIRTIYRSCALAIRLRFACAESRLAAPRAGRE